MTISYVNRPSLAAAKGPRPPEPLIRLVRTAAEADRGNVEHWEEVSVYCGKCLRRAFDVTAEMEYRIVIDDIVDYRRTGAAMIERACPKCQTRSVCTVTLAAGHRLPEGHHGAWHCPDCTASLAFVDGATGKVKAACSRCHANVTTTAKRALSGDLSSVDLEKFFRQSMRTEPCPS